MGFIQRRLEERFTPYLPIAVRFVSQYYGIPEKPIPKFMVGLKPTTEETLMGRTKWIGWYTRETGQAPRFRSEKVYEKIAHWLYNLGEELRLSASYKYVLDTVHTSWLFAITGTAREIRTAIVHESVHHAQNENIIWVEKDFEIRNQLVRRKALYCAMEGMATDVQQVFLEMLPKPNISERILGNLSMARRYACFMAAAPFEYFTKLLDEIISKLPKVVQKKIGEFVDRHPFFARFVWSYGAGYRFVKETMELVGGPHELFELFCRMPPVTMREIFDPEWYVQHRTNLSLALERKFLI